MAGTTMAVHPELFGQVDDAADRVGLAEKAAAWKPGLVQCFGCLFQEYGGAS